jgi:DNA-binding response OmpR family regulator
MHILLAEDDGDIRALVDTILSNAGYGIEAYSDGLSVLEASPRQSATLYVLDIQMPNVTGLDVCRRLRADPATCDSPILLMSAECGPGSVAAALTAGADDFLAKPFTRRELLLRVGQLVSPRLPRTA